MIITSTHSRLTGPARRFAPASGAPFGVPVCPNWATPSFIRGSFFGVVVGVPQGIQGSTDQCAQKLAFADRTLGLAAGPLMAQGYGRSAPIARRC